MRGQACRVPLGETNSVNSAHLERAGHAQEPLCELGPFGRSLLSLEFNDMSMLLSSVVDLCPARQMTGH